MRGPYITCLVSLNVPHMGMLCVEARVVNWTVLGRNYITVLISNANLAQNRFVGSRSRSGSGSGSN